MGAEGEESYGSSAPLIPFFDTLKLSRVFPLPNAREKQGKPQRRLRLTSIRSLETCQIWSRWGPYIRTLQFEDNWSE